MRNSLNAISSILALKWAHMVPAISGLLLCAWYLLPSVASELANPERKVDTACETAESCFKSAAAIREKSGDTGQRDQALSIKLDQLRLVTERHPASLWAKRATLLRGVLLIDQDPAEAIRYLRSAQRDFLQLDDYLRLWIGEALAKLNDRTEAIRIFQSIHETVPDSSLVTRAAYRTGETAYLSDECSLATEWFVQALALNDKDAAAPSALIHLADCYGRQSRVSEARSALKLVWTRFPQTSEAREARDRLDAKLGEESWTPTADDYYQRAQAFLALAMQAEAVEDIRRFLGASPQHPRRFEARLKLGIAQTRLKQYDQARDTFRGLSAERVQESHEATVWLARIYLRQGLGDKLQEMARLAQSSSLSGDQKAMVHLFLGIWLEDQARYDDAIAAFREVAKSGDSTSQRAEGLWRVGWVFYRTARYPEAIQAFQSIIDAQTTVFEPQAFYWLARAYESNKDPKAREYYVRICERHEHSYYCQLAARRADIPVSREVESVPVSVNFQEPVRLPETRRPEIERHPAYRRAVELKILGLTQDAARELAVLTEQYSRDEEVLLAFSTLLNEVGAYYPALRLAKIHFREKLERGGLSSGSPLWTVAYPTGLVPTIQAQGVKQVDPY
ncbi:MAG: tetratricopeptide repeat protein, partial [Nitrospiraceae bacterium]